MNIKDFYRKIEYKMPTDMAINLLMERKGADAKKDNQQFLCDYVNEQLGLLGNCTRVLFS